MVQMQDLPRDVKETGLGVIVAVLAVVVNDWLRFTLGPESDWWEEARQTTVPVIHDIVDGFGGYASYPMEDDEYAGTMPMHPEEAERRLASEGFIRNPIAALKTREGADGETEMEVGSWVYREKKTARRQLHVMLFRNPTDGETHTDLYAHEEYSSLNPRVAYEHYTAEDYDPETGIERVTTIFDLEQPNQ